MRTVKLVPAILCTLGLSLALVACGKNKTTSNAKKTASGAVVSGAGLIQSNCVSLSGATANVFGAGAQFSVCATNDPNTLEIAYDNATVWQSYAVFLSSGMVPFSEVNPPTFQIGGAHGATFIEFTNASGSFDSVFIVSAGNAATFNSKSLVNDNSNAWGDWSYAKFR